MSTDDLDKEPENNPNPPQGFAIRIWADGIVTSTNGEPVPEQPERRSAS